MDPILPEHPGGPITLGEVYRAVRRSEQALAAFMSEMRETHTQVALHEQTLSAHAHEIKNLKQVVGSTKEVESARDAIQIPINAKTLTVLFLVLGSLIASLLVAMADRPISGTLPATRPAVENRP